MSQNVVTLEPVLLKPSDVMSLTQLGRNRVYELLASGAIPSIRLGRRQIRIRRQDLDAWLERARGAA